MSELVSTSLSMIQLSDLTKSFGDRVLLDHVTWQITDRERVGLCGPNGAGKTTLLKMMAGLDEPDSGAILKPAALTVGYLPQDGLTPRRPHGLRRSVAARSSELLGDEGRDARARGAARRPGDSRSRARRDARTLQRPAGSLPAARRLQHRAEDGDGAAGPRLQDRRLRAADRDVLRRLADAHRARQAAARPARTCCCSTSRPTISISRRATGSRTT